MASKEQEKPLAPAQITFTDDDALSMELKKQSRHRKYVKCCGCITALLLIQVVVVLVLIFTIFNVKDPVIKMNSVRIDGLDRINITNLQPGTNLTVVADVSVKNPNRADFKFRTATTSLYYGDVVVGEATTPPGKAKARRTVRLNVTMDVMIEKILGVSQLSTDLRLGALSMRSYTSITGRVKTLGIIKKTVVVRMNCTMVVDIRARAIQDQNCRSHVSI